MPLPVLDSQKLDELRSLVGDDGGEFIREYLATFLKYTEEKMRELETAVSHKDSDVLRSVGHALKSSCANTGAASMTALCVQIEELGKKQDALNAIGPHAQLKAEYAKVKQAIAQIPEMAQSPKKVA